MWGQCEKPISESIYTRLRMPPQNTKRPKKTDRTRSLKCAQILVRGPVFRAHGPENEPEIRTTKFEGFVLTSSLRISGLRY